MTTHSASNSAALRREVRIGLVLYGGVSLAIYIYGVCQEFLRLAQASTALDGRKPSEGEGANAYTQALKDLNARALVDIIAGASAGGINGVALAKALVLGENLDHLRQVWVDEGDFERLLNSPNRRDADSLVNADRYEAMVRDTLCRMDGVDPAGPGHRVAGGAKDPCDARNGLVPVLDLFVTATNLYGRLINSRDELNKTIQTKSYRKVFHRKLRTREYQQNDFTCGHNATLAKMCRATSAFPLAIAPLVADPGHLKGVDPEDGEDRRLYLADGGILDNKPFTQMLNTIFSRSAEGLVERVVFYVEPDPEPVDEPAATKPRPKPDALSIAALASSGIPRYEGIDDDLRAIQEHNDQVRRLAGALRQSIPNVDETATDSQTFRKQLQSQLAWRMYHNLKLSDLKRELGQTFSRNVGRCNAHAQTAFCRALDARTADDEKAATFLQTFDLPFQVRRRYHLIETLAPLYDAFAKRGMNKELDELRKSERGLWEVLASARYAQWAAWEMGTDTSPGPFAPDLLALRAVRSDEDARQAVARYLDRVQRYLNGALNGPPPNPAIVPIHPRGRELCAALDEMLEPLRRSGDKSGAESNDELAKLLRSKFAVIQDQYEVRDIILYPVSALSRLGERDEVKLVRVSPDAAQFIPRPFKNKLAGNAVMHFGGFLKREWRQSDIMWGRLDAAELIVRTLAKNYLPPYGVMPLSKEDAEKDVERRVREVQKEIVQQEQKKLDTEAQHGRWGRSHTILNRLEQLDDYREFLQDPVRYKIGAQDGISAVYLARLGFKAVQVLGNMMNTVEAQKDASPVPRAVASIIGALLSMVNVPLRTVSWFIRGWSWPLGFLIAPVLALLTLVLTVVLAVILTTAPIGLLAGASALARNGWSRLLVGLAGVPPLVAGGLLAWRLLASREEAPRLVGTFGLPLALALLLITGVRFFRHSGTGRLAAGLVAIGVIAVVFLWSFWAF